MPDLSTPEAIEKWLRGLPHEEQKSIYISFCFSDISMEVPSNTRKGIEALYDLDPQIAAEWFEEAKVRHDLIEKFVIEHMASAR